MKVCSCCYRPEVIKGDRLLDSIKIYIIVSDDTPVFHEGDKDYFISPEVFEKVGLSWARSAWHLPNGGMIDRNYDISTGKVKPVMEEWKRQLLSGKLTRTIPFLKSAPKNKTTLGSGIHTQRKDEILLGLFDEYLLDVHGYDINFDYQSLKSGNFPGSYGKVSGVGFQNPMIPLDFEDIRFIERSIAEDKKKLAEDGIMDASDSSDESKEYRYKLYRSLKGNLHRLEVATEETKLYLNAGLTNINVLLSMHESRCNTNAAKTAVHQVYEEMSLLLVPKLIAAGFYDGEPPEDGWEYSEE